MAGGGGGAGPAGGRVCARAGVLDGCCLLKCNLRMHRLGRRETPAELEVGTRSSSHPRPSPFQPHRRRLRFPHWPPPWSRPVPRASYPSPARPVRTVPSPLSVRSGTAACLLFCAPHGFLGYTQVLACSSTRAGPRAGPDQDQARPLSPGWHSHQGTVCFVGMELSSN